MSDINLARVFPTTIFYYTIPNHKELNKKLIKEIYRLEKSSEDKNVIRSNQGGYHSNLDLQLNSKFNDLTKEILKVSNEIIARDYTYEIYYKQGYKVNKIKAMWFNINKYLNHNTTHMHPNSWVSGAYYLKTPDIKSKCLDFDDPVRERTYTESFSANTYRHPVCEGMLVLFPGWLTHSVPPNMSKEDRITISFNICKPKDNLLVSHKE